MKKKGLRGPKGAFSGDIREEIEAGLTKLMKKTKAVKDADDPDFKDSVEKLWEQITEDHPEVDDKSYKTVRAQ